MITQHEYQVSWPPNKPRRSDRKNGQFQVNLATAAERVEKELLAFTKPGRDWRTKRLVIFADVPASCIGARGRFLAGSRPHTPEVAVSFDLDGKECHICADAFTDAAQNLAGIAEYIKAIRAQERNGICAQCGNCVGCSSEEEWEKPERDIPRRASGPSVRYVNRQLGPQLKWVWFEHLGRYALTNAGKGTVPVRPLTPYRMVLYADAMRATALKSAIQRMKDQIEKEAE